MKNKSEMIEKNRLNIDQGYLFQDLIPNDLRHIKKIIYALKKSSTCFKNNDLIKYCNDLCPQFEIAFKFLYDISIKNKLQIDISTNKNCTNLKLKECKCIFKNSGIIYDTHKGFNILTTLPLDTITEDISCGGDTFVAFFLEHLIEALAISAELRVNQINYLFGSDLEKAENKEFIQKLHKYYTNLCYYCSYHDKIFESYSN
jgi:hypothetical protein